MVEVKKAVALKYDREENNAPEVVAKGKGPVADNIMNIARQLGVPIVENSEVVNVLDGVEVGQEIPQDLYMIVAEIFSFIHKLSADKVKMALD